MYRSLFVVVLTVSLPTAARAQLAQSFQFATGGGSVSCAYAPLSDTVWSYGGFGATLYQFSTSGSLLNTLPRPGGSADDADLEIAPVAFTLGTTLVPHGSLLYIDGESGVAEIYAVDPSTGAVLASLVTSFGNSHVVGGAYHPQRGTFFLVQDRVPSSAAQKNLVAEVDPVTGAVLGSFQTTAANPAFTVNYGDLDVTANGNLLIVSSDESQIGQFTPGGAWVDGHALPAGVGSLAGIGIDETGCTVWVIATNGTATELSTGCPSVMTIGAGCGNHSIAVTQLPWAGSAFRARSSGLPANGLVFALTGLSALAQPIDLSSVLRQALPSCFAYVPSDVLALLPIVGGAAEAAVALPAGAWTVGISIYHQHGVLELHAGTQAVLRVTATDALRVTIGSY